MDQKDYFLIGQNLLFRGVDFVSVQYMLEHCSIRTLAADEKLLQPDMPNQHLYLILEGELSVELIAQEALQHTLLGAGECAGEISLVDGKPPSAVVIATKHARVLAVPHDTVWSLVYGSHAVARNLLEIIAGRMRNDNRALVTSRNRSVQYEHQASVDALTGIHNRRWMNEAFPRALHRCILNRLSCAVLVVDIDHFKRVNDNYGHLVGDVALKTVAATMSSHLRPHDLLVRYGGEEFAVLLPDTALGEAREVAERIRAAIEAQAVEHQDLSFNVTISIGIATGREGVSHETMIGEADQALYRAKESGRNRVEVAV